MMPMALAAKHYPEMVHRALDLALAQATPAVDGGQIVVPLWQDTPATQDKREAAVIDRLTSGPQRYGAVVQTRMDAPALMRLVSRGQVILAGVTPSDASHVLGKSDAWDAEAAEKALTLFARKRGGNGDTLAPDAATLAQQIINQLAAQTVDCLLDAAFAEDPRDWDATPSDLTRHTLTRAGLDHHTGIIATTLKLGVPVIGLGASASTYYGPVGERLSTQMIIPDHAHVANAIGAVVGQVAMRETGTVTSGGEGALVAHLSTGPQSFADQDAALHALETDLSDLARAKAKAAGVDAPRLSLDRDIQTATIEGRQMFVEATIIATAHGRPRIATG